MRGVLIVNAAAGIGRIYRGGQREEIIWTEDELVAFEVKAVEPGMAAAAGALRFCAVTDPRCQDLVTLTWAQIQAFAIIKKRAEVVMEEAALCDRAAHPDVGRFA